jgi:hypothetical protein
MATINQQAFLDAVGKLRQRFPSVLRGTTTLHIQDWSDESGLIAMFEDFIAICKSDELDASYSRQVNATFGEEHGAAAGVGMANACLELRCRALIRALDSLH